MSAVIPVDDRSETAVNRNITRISKACEACRSRKTKCDISTRPVCSECVKRNTVDECILREKARRRRVGSTVPKQTNQGSPVQQTSENDSRRKRRRSRSSSLRPIDHLGTHVLDLTEPEVEPLCAEEKESSRTARGTDRSSCVTQIENIAAGIARRVYDIRLNLALPSENVLPNYTRYVISLHDIGLTPGNPASAARSRHWINMHFGGISATARSASDLSGDERALLYAILALGAFREETWDASQNQYKMFGRNGFAGPSPGTAQRPATTSPAGNMMPDQIPITNGSASMTASMTLFQLSSDELDNLSCPSDIAVQTLFLLHTFVSNTRSGRRSRDFIARAVMMAHETGLNRSVPTVRPTTTVDKEQQQEIGRLKRRSILYLYVCFADQYIAALDNQPPLIKSGDYDVDIFDRISEAAPLEGISSTPTSPGLSAFVDLVRTQGQVLESLHRNLRPDTSTSLEQILELDRQLDSLRERLGLLVHGSDTSFDSNLNEAERARVAGRLLRHIHYNWCRLAVRVPYLDHPLLGHSSLTICVRAASSILLNYRVVCAAGLLNLPWMQVQRISSCINLIFIGCWRGELLNNEAEQAVDHVLFLANILGTRWASATDTLVQSVNQMSRLTGLRYRQEFSTISRLGMLPANPRLEQTEPVQDQSLLGPTFGSRFSNGVRAFRPANASLVAEGQFESSLEGLAWLAMNEPQLMLSGNTPTLGSDIADNYANLANWDEFMQSLV